MAQTSHMATLDSKQARKSTVGKKSEKAGASHQQCPCLPVTHPLHSHWPIAQGLLLMDTPVTRQLFLKLFWSNFLLDLIKSSFGV